MRRPNRQNVVFVNCSASNPPPSHSSTLFHHPRSHGLCRKSQSCVFDDFSIPLFGFGSSGFCHIVGHCNVLLLSWFCLKSLKVPDNCHVDFSTAGAPGAFHHFVSATLSVLRLSCQNHSGSHLHDVPDYLDSLSRLGQQHCSLARNSGFGYVVEFVI